MAAGIFSFLFAPLAPNTMKMPDQEKIAARLQEDSRTSAIAVQHKKIVQLTAEMFANRPMNQAGLVIGTLAAIKRSGNCLSQQEKSQIWKNLTAVLNDCAK